MKTTKAARMQSGAAMRKPFSGCRSACALHIPQPRITRPALPRPRCGSLKTNQANFSKAQTQTTAPPKNNKRSLKLTIIHPLKIPCPHPMHHTLFLPDEAATLAFGERTASLFRAPVVIHLQGNLGAGKTTFTRGLLRGLGHTGAVKSPTYAIVESYALPQTTVHHFDLYRFTSPEEWLDAGLDDLIPNSIVLIEWAGQGGEYAPAPDYIIQLEPRAHGRQCTLQACTPAAQKELDQWQK